MPEESSRPFASVEEEAHRLAQAAGEWFRSHRAGTGETGETEPGPHADPAADGHQAAGDHAGCRDCPWCRARAAVGSHGGADVVEGLADLLASASESLRLLARSRREAPGGGDPPQEEGR